jgi:hypothetical protein
VDDVPCLDLAQPGPSSITTHSCPIPEQILRLRPPRTGDLDERPRQPLAGLAGPPTHEAAQPRVLVSGVYPNCMGASLSRVLARPIVAGTDHDWMRLRQGSDGARLPDVQRRRVRRRSAALPTPSGCARRRHPPPRARATLTSSRTAARSASPGGILFTAGARSVLRPRPRILDPVRPDLGKPERDRWSIDSVTWPCASRLRQEHISNRRPSRRGSWRTTASPAD